MRSGYAFGAICYKKCELEYRRCKHIFHAEKYILTLLCLSTHTYTHPRAHTHTYIFNINLVCQVILKSSERDILYDFHLNDCIIYFISCDSDEFFVIPFNAFCQTPVRLTRPGITSTVEAIIFIADVAEWTYD